MVNEYVPADEGSPLLGSMKLDKTRSMTALQLAVWIYVCVNGGPYGIEEAASSNPPLYLLIALLVIPWMWCFPLAMITSELSSRYPESSGGIGTWVMTAFGKDVGAIVAFTYIVTNVFDSSLYPMLMAKYLVPKASSHWIWTAISMCPIVTATAINCQGVEIAGKTAIVLSVCTILPIMLLCAFEVSYFDVSNWVNSKPLTDDTSISLL